MKRRLKRYGAIGAVVGYLALLVIMYWRELSADQRINATTAYLLFVTLMVVWWYADTTQDQADLSHKAYIEGNKPVVFTDRWEHPEREGNVHYLIRNAGGGVAINVYYIELDEDGTFHPPIALGSLPAAAERRLPEQLNRRLCEPYVEGAGNRHLLIAEGLFTRATQWTPTLNFRTPSTDSRRGHVQHAFGRPPVRPPNYEHQPLADYLDANATTLAAELRKLK